MKTCLVATAVVMLAVASSAGDRRSGFHPPVEARKPTAARYAVFADGKRVALSAEESRKLEAKLSRFRRLSAIDRNVHQAIDAVEHRWRVKEADRRLDNASGRLTLAPAGPIGVPRIAH